MSPVFPAEVTVTPKPEVADPQGQAIEQALKRLKLGENEVSATHVRVGRIFHLQLDAPDRATAERVLDTLADKILANPNIETYQCTLGEPKE